MAVRAFDPELPLRPSLVRYAARLQQGILRQAFAAMSSLVPGALPAGTDGEGVMLVHCLDARPGLVGQLAADEALLARALDAPIEHV